MNSKHICKFCKRSFPCGRSLGGHIRSHLIHRSNPTSAPNVEPDSSKPRYELRENPKKTYKDSNLLCSSSSPWSDESETEDGSDPNPRNRVRNPNGKSIFGGNHSYSSASEVVEPEQEEISGAMCLIMLSRDVGNWGAFTNNGNRKGQNSKSLASGYFQDGSKMEEFEVSANGFTSNDQNNHPFHNKRKVDDLDHKMKMVTSVSGHVRSGSKMKEFDVSKDRLTLNLYKVNDHEVGREDIEISSEMFKNSYKRSKFECTTCNKVFSSYQALGGHRASHKKVVGSMKVSNGEDFLSPHQDQPDQEQEQVTKSEIGSSSSSQSIKKVVQKYECPICLRVFSSGQALGGHKRSHVLAANNTNNCEINLVESSSGPEIRDFLDLNLPPTPAEEVTNPLVGLIKPYWFVENSHNHEPILRLVSN